MSSITEKNYLMILCKINFRRVETYIKFTINITIVVYSFSNNF